MRMRLIVLLHVHSLSCLKCCILLGVVGNGQNPVILSVVYFFQNLLLLVKPYNCRDMLVQISD
jgi:hypothetical protein